MMERLTIDEWCKRKRVTIFDPDGFDRRDPNLYSRLFTEQEFMRGLMLCSILWEGDKEAPPHA
jgi:hypothetical protein